MSILDHMTHHASLRETLANTATKVIDWFDKNSGRGKAAALAAHLSAMSDDELSELGLTRDEIFHHAFQRFMY